MNQPLNKYSNQLDCTCSYCNQQVVYVAKAICVNAEESDFVVFREACEEHKKLLKEWASEVGYTRKELQMPDRQTGVTVTFVDGNKEETVWTTLEEQHDFVQKLMQRGGRVTEAKQELEPIEVKKLAIRFVHFETPNGNPFGSKEEYEEYQEHLERFMLKHQLNRQEQWECLTCVNDLLSDII